MLAAFLSDKDSQDVWITCELVGEAIENTKDFVRSTYQPVAAVAARGGSLKEAWDACRAACDPKFSDYAIYEHCLPFNVARAYDEALGIDTSSPPELGPAAAAPQLTEGGAWFYALDNERQGPVTEETIRHLLRAKAVDRATLVWREGFADWIPLGDTDAFAGDAT